MKTPELFYGDYFKKDKWAKRRFFLAHELLAPLIKENISLLDIGCYQADFLRIIKVPVNYYGVDFDKKALAIASKRGAITAWVDLEKDKIPFKKKFDLVILTELLEHLKDPEPVLAQSARLLKSKGYALISLPNECNLYHRLRVLFGKGIDSSGFEPFYHLHFPTLAQNEEFINQYYRILERRYNVHFGLGGFWGKFFSLVPITIWEKLGQLAPTLFARGGIYLCQKKEKR